jgi:hypothetical protein
MHSLLGLYRQQLLAASSGAGQEAYALR